MHRMLVLIPFSAAAFAGTIGTFTFTGTGTGSISGIPFANVTLTVTAPGDFSTVSCASGVCFLHLAAGAASFTIDGLSGTFSDPTYFFDNQTSTLFGLPAGVAGFGDGSDVIQMYGALIGTPIFGTYDLQSAIGPLGPQASDPSTADWSNLSTSLGNFTVTSFNDFTFQVTTAIPEPDALILVGVSLCGLAIWRFRSPVKPRTAVRMHLENRN